MYRSCLAGDCMEMSRLQVVIIRPGLCVGRDQCSLLPQLPGTGSSTCLLGSRGDWCNWNKILERCLNGGNRNIFKSIFRANYQESRIKRDTFNKMCQMLVDIAQAIQIIILMIGNYYWAGGSVSPSPSARHTSAAVSRLGSPPAPALSSYLHNEKSGPNGPHSPPPAAYWNNLHKYCTNINISQQNQYIKHYLNGFHGASPTNMIFV